MSTVFVVFVILAVLLGIILLCFGVSWLEKREHGKEFDERQTLARLRASNLSQNVGFVYFLISMCVMIYQVDNPKTIEPYLLVFFGYFLQMAVCQTYCMIHHAALPFAQKPRTSIIGFVFSGLMMLLYVPQNIRRDGPLSFTGHGSASWIFLVAGIYSLYLAVLLTIQSLRREKE